MFDQAVAFDQAIGDWNVSSVYHMGEMFSGATAFNQDIGDWNMSTVEIVSAMFKNASSFNQDIGAWDLGSVNYASKMFDGATAFNQDVGDWDVSNISDMQYMFRDAIAFNQDIGDWDISGSDILGLEFMLDNSGISVTNYDSILKKWSDRQTISNIKLGAAGLHYCLSAAERQNLIDNYNWIINDAGLDCSTVNTSEIPANNLTAYPNPTSTSITIEFDQLSKGILKIFGPSGRLVYNQQVDNSGNIDYLIEGPQGLYLLEFVDADGKVFLGKVLKVD